MNRCLYSGHKLYFKDDFLFTELSSDDNALYTSDGIPVVIKSLSIDYKGTTDKEISYNITLWEDRYTDI